MRAKRISCARNITFDWLINWYSSSNLCMFFRYSSVTTTITKRRIIFINMSIEVLFTYEKERIRRPEDAAVCCLHSYMTASGYKCIGIGEKVNKITLLLARLHIGSTCHRLIRTTRLLKVVSKFISYLGDTRKTFDNRCLIRFTKLGLPITPESCHIFS